MTLASKPCWYDPNVPVAPRNTPYAAMAAGTATDRFAGPAAAMLPRAPLRQPSRTLAGALAELRAQQRFSRHVLYLANINSGKIGIYVKSHIRIKQVMYYKHT
eukprot:5996436-Pleurochrysis_carterae.AAC.1